MTKTPADEALKAFNNYAVFIADDNDLTRGEANKYSETIRTALSLLSAVQGGKAYVYESPPECEADAEFTVIDAAESYAAPSAAEVGE